MRIHLRLLCQADVTAVLAQNPVMVSTLDLDSTVFELDSESEIFDQVLELTKDTSGCWLNPVMRFTRAEMVQVRYFQLECRGRIIRETQKDYALNSARVNALPFIHTSDRTKIKLLDRIALSKISLKPNGIGCASDWMAEYILTDTVTKVFERAGFTGFSPRLVFSPQAGKNHETYFQLYTENIMPLAELDLTTPSLENEIREEGGYRQLGCLTYDFQGDEFILDFNRTAENWSNNFMPFWVVTARIKECFERNKLRGWGFRPVLEKGTGLHLTYLAKWESLFKRIAINPRNRF